MSELALEVKIIVHKYEFITHDYRRSDNRIITTFIITLKSYIHTSDTVQFVNSPVYILFATKAFITMHAHTTDCVHAL